MAVLSVCRLLFRSLNLEGWLHKLPSTQTHCYTHAITPTHTHTHNLTHTATPISIASQIPTAFFQWKSHLPNNGRRIKWHWRQFAVSRRHSYCVSGGELVEVQTTSGGSVLHVRLRSGWEMAGCRALAPCFGNHSGIHAVSASRLITGSCIGCVCVIQDRFCPHI